MHDPFQQGAAQSFGRLSRQTMIQSLNKLAQLIQTLMVMQAEYQSKQAIRRQGAVHKLLFLLNQQIFLPGLVAFQQQRRRREKI